MKTQNLPARDPLGFLQPYFSGYETFSLSSGDKIEVPKFTLQFKKWDGEKLLYTLGGKAVLEVAGKPQFAELAIADFFKQHGFDTRWAETYGQGGDLPLFLSEWQNKPLKDQASHPIDEAWITEMLKDIANLNGESFSGCWDVIAWKDKQLYFIESKRRKKDSLRDTQRHWINSAMRYGLAPENFIVIEWDEAP